MNTTDHSLWQDLLQAGVVTGSPPLDTSTQSPWYVRVMLGVAGWIAAIFILGFIAVGLEFIIKDTSISIAAGSIFIAGAYTVFKKVHNDFAEQFALALSLAGQALILFGVMDFFKWNASTPWFIAAVLQAVIAILMPNSIQRMLAGYLCCITLHAAFAILGAPSIIPTVTGVAAALLWLNEFYWYRSHHFSSIGLITRPIAYGITIALLQLKGQILFANNIFLSLHSHGQNYSFVPPWVTELTSGMLLVVVVGILMYRNGQSLYSRRMNIVLLLTGAIAAVSLEAPGIATGLVIILIGFANCNRILFGLGISALLFYISAYYYNLQVTLLTKSGILAATGIVLLLARWVVSQWVFAAEENRDE